MFRQLSECVKIVCNPKNWEKWIVSWLNNLSDGLKRFTGRKGHERSEDRDYGTNGMTKPQGKEVAPGFWVDGESITVDTGGYDKLISDVLDGTYVISLTGGMGPARSAAFAIPGLASRGGPGTVEDLRIDLTDRMRYIKHTPWPGSRPRFIDPGLHHEPGAGYGTNGDSKCQSK